MFVTLFESLTSEIAVFLNIVQAICVVVDFSRPIIVARLVQPEKCEPPATPVRPVKLIDKSDVHPGAKLESAKANLASLGKSKTLRFVQFWNWLQPSVVIVDG